MCHHWVHDWRRLRGVGLQLQFTERPGNCLRWIAYRSESVYQRAQGSGQVREFERFLEKRCLALGVL